MNLFTMDLGKLTYSDIEAFCRQDLPENMRLDYKREFSSKSARNQIIKCVSAFANTQGGVILYGVRTVKRQGKEYPFWPSVGMTPCSDFEKQVTRWCIEHIAPPIVPMVGYVENPNDKGKSFGVIRVEMSRLTPHTVDGGTLIYVRRADNSDPITATFQEIELLRNQRIRAIELEEQHLADLRERIGLSPPPTNRSMFLILTPQFSTDNAIGLTQLPDVARDLQHAGFKVNKVKSYSYGLISKSDDFPGWTFILTSRAGLAIGFNHALSGKKSDEPLILKNLLDWSLLAADGIRILCEKAGYWGTYNIIFAAIGYEGIQVVYKTADFQPPGKCFDPRIKINMEWSTIELRENKYKPAAALFWRMMWAFGQHDNILSMDDIESILRNRQAYKQPTFRKGQS